MPSIESEAVPSRESPTENLPTAGQITFDVLAGIALPLFCLLADPIVFRSRDFEDAFLGNFCVVGYSAIAIGVLSLTLWLLFQKFPVVFAGLLIGSAIHATLLGVLLLPFSVICLMAFIGLLGFSPFVTAFVLWRNSHRAYKMAGSLSHPTQQFIAMTSVVLVCLAPWAAQAYCNMKVAIAILQIESGKEMTISRGVNFFRKYRFIVSPAPLITSYQQTDDEVRRQAFSQAFLAITGKNLEEELVRLED